MTNPLFMQEIDEHGVAWLTLTRPEVHNAFNDTLIAELTSALNGLATDERARAVVLGGRGRSFSAGADLSWMQRMADYSKAENKRDARALADLMAALNRLPKPTIARVHGAAIGGGVGLVACCDIAIAAQTATFCLSEVKLGLTPAVISPYVVAAMGQRAARRYFLTAETFSARDALASGLVHLVVVDEAMDDAVDKVLRAIRAGGPRAQAAAKDLIYAVSNRPLDDAIIDDTAERIARQRVGAEAQEGISAFLQKRKPEWLKE